jgi:uncharacterized integral membrane protein
MRSSSLSRSLCLLQTGLILATAASSIGLVINIEPRSTQHATVIAAAFTLLLGSALLSLWAALLYLLGAVRISHPLSRPFNSRDNGLFKWILVYILHWDTLTRFINALSL